MNNLQMIEGKDLADPNNLEIIESSSLRGRRENWVLG